MSKTCKMAQNDHSCKNMQNDAKMGCFRALNSHFSRNNLRSNFFISESCFFKPLLLSSTNFQFLQKHWKHRFRLFWKTCANTWKTPLFFGFLRYMQPLFIMSVLMHPSWKKVERSDRLMKKWVARGVADHVIRVFTTWKCVFKSCKSASRERVLHLHLFTFFSFVISVNVEKCAYYFTM